MTVQSAYQEEQRRLTESLRDISAQLQAIGPRYKGDDFTEQMLDLQQEERRQRLEISKKEPYFGRIDFQELPAGEPKPLYIGKAGVAKQGSNELLVIDWRAPVASLFYSFTGGDAPAAYESPDGEISGHVHLKRNFMIRQGEIVRLVDSFVRGQEEGSVTDEFLLYRLGENKDNKLRDIVSTIQGEQDRIIRAERGKALFIQGVAGSGKTTVALHRLAYLLYQYADRMRAERMIIFAPNRMFLDYISGVLPELGVGDIQQTTFGDWAFELLEKSVTLQDPSETMAYWFEQHRTAEEIEHSSGRFKGSLAFKAIVDEKLADFEKKIVPVVPFVPVDGLELPPALMREWYDTDYGEETLMNKRDRLVSRIRRWFESELKMRKIADKKIRSKALAKFNAFTKKIPSYSSVELYASLFQGKQASKGIPKAIAERTGERLGKNAAAAEDLAPLAYIQLQLYGLPKQAFDHIVIDEAQDYSPFQLEVLRLCQRTASMTVLGDLQQGIHAYAGIQSWSELTSIFVEEQVGFFELNRSYRSTMEIIEFANKILGEMTGGVKPAVPVFRSGDPVESAESARAGWLADIASTVRLWREQGHYETISVIGRTAQECERIHTHLLDSGFDASLVQSKQPAYGGGLSVVPVYLSKGLEFDAVLIADAGEEAYSGLDAKLLYVGCTRALHKLKLLHIGSLTPLIGK
ncbi:HelD family protein [Paenibacillus arenilitoris]|uniref:UvrD-helicase domain-containing protein n=1 Tax=Paenibacillus arenilitoris TaxID=2772299 RepID=A0A927CQX7_9BACL|nr:UvrD-helicase domain-containing protein [Paenibacillus arenilitoris]MBD2871178.1 UvrD-helicase domain-containing protein [Paenibacillus arenilitoris]